MKGIITRMIVGLLLIVGVPLKLLILTETVTDEISRSFNTQLYILCWVLLGLIILELHKRYKKNKISIEVAKHLDECFKTIKPDGLNELIKLVSNAISEDEKLKGDFLVLQRALIHLNNNKDIKMQYGNVLVKATNETLPSYFIRKIYEVQGIEIKKVPMGSGSETGLK